MEKNVMELFVSNGRTLAVFYFGFRRNQPLGSGNQGVVCYF